MSAKRITDTEKNIVGKSLERLNRPRRYICDIKKRIITIYESNQDIDRLKELFGDLAGSGLSEDESALTAVIDKAVNYSPVMRFILEDDEKRTFIAERFCFLGSIDDWIPIEGPDSLKKLVGLYIGHLGKDSLYEIY